MNHPTRSAFSARGRLEQTFYSSLFIFGALLLIFTSATLQWLLSQQFADQQAQQRQYQAQQLAYETAAYSSPFLQSRNIISLNLLLKQVMERPEVVAGSIRDDQSAILTELSETHDTNRALTVQAPVTLDNQLLGYVSLTTLYPQGTGSGLTFLMVGIIAVMLWFVFCLWLNGRLQEDFNRFNQVMQNALGIHQNTLKGWQTLLSGSLNPALRITGLINQRLDEPDIQLLQEQLSEPPITGRYMEGCLLYIAPAFANFAGQNPDPDAHQMERWLERQDLYLKQVAQLYDGALTQDKHCLLFGKDGDPEQAVVQAICAAQVLYHLCGSLVPSAISLSSGTIWISTSPDVPPAIQVQGATREELHLIHLYNSGQHILMAENMFQYGRINELVEASIDRDLNLPDGRRLEIWRLEMLKENYEKLLLNQADQLMESL